MSERLANLIGTVPLEWAGHPHRSRSDVLRLGRMAAYPRRLPWFECWAIVGLVAAFGFAMALSLHHDCTVAPSEVDAPEPGTPRATFCATADTGHPWLLMVLPAAVAFLVVLASRRRSAVVVWWCIAIATLTALVAGHAGALDYADSV